MMNPQPIVLEGRFIRLEPMRPEHAEAFAAIGLGQDLFRWYPYSMDTPEDMRAFVRLSLAAQAKGIAVPFTTVSCDTGQVIGSTSFLKIERANRGLEIGATWIAPPWQRSACNTEAKYLQLRHCFEDLGCIRVEFKTDSLNHKSRAALARIGAVEEGTFRNHMICPGGRIRHSVYFSILDSEWPHVKQLLQDKLATGGASSVRCFGRGLPIPN